MLTNRQDSFIAKVEVGLQRGLEQACLTKPSSLLVALSGGPDSLSLLLALTTLSGGNGIEIEACHVNHHLRGKAADDDEAFCVEFCKRLGVPIIVEHLQLKDFSEDALRQARYEALCSLASRGGSSAVVTGHTADDQIETILFRLLRGSGPCGLLGMEPAKLLDNTQVVRPLLELTKKDCLEFLERCKVRAQHDATNDQLDKTRNFIRHRLIPTIEERFAGFADALRRLRCLMAEDQELLDSLVLDARNKLCSGASNKDDVSNQAWDLLVFQQFPAALKRRLIADQLRRIGASLTFARTEQILGLVTAGSGALSLDEQTLVSVSQGKLYWHREGKQDTVVKPKEEYLVNVPGITTASAFGKVLAVEGLNQADKSELFPPAQSQEALVDLSKISLPLVLRQRQPGDVICPFGMTERVKLKKYLHTHKPKEIWQDSSPQLVLATMQEVLWVPGVGLSNKVRVDDCPTHRLTLLSGTAGCSDYLSNTDANYFINEE